MTLNGLKLLARNKYIRISSNCRRKLIHNEKFTIISNNCWGGLVYESYNLEKRSPTIGMFFMAEEFIKFLQNIKYYTQECEIKFIAPEKARHKKFYEKDKRFGSYPIARLDDVEIAMLHFHTEQQAAEKWKRRCKRINWDHLLVKMNDQNECEKTDLEHFLQLPFENKIFFTTRKEWEGIPGVTYLKSKNTEQCGLFDEPFGASRKVNINKIVESL